MMMDHLIDLPGLGVAHWLLFAAMVAVFLYPIGRILGRLGISPFWSVLALVPLVNLVALWILAFADWPATPKQEARWNQS
jgi:hypothetical protein